MSKKNKKGETSRSWLARPAKSRPHRHLNPPTKTPFSPLKRSQKLSWLLLSLFSFLITLHFASSNLPSLYIAKLRNPKDQTGIEVFNSFGPITPTLFSLSTLLSLTAFLYFFRFSYLTLRARISIFELFKSHALILIAAFAYFMLYKETSSSFMILISLLFMLSLLPSKFKKNYLITLLPYPLSRPSKIFLTLVLSSIFLISFSEGYATYNFNNSIERLVVKEDAKLNSVLKSVLAQNSYQYKYHLLDPSTKNIANPIEGSFNSDNCEESGNRLDSIAQKDSKTAKTVKSYWIRKDGVYYSNYADLGFVRDDSRVNHIGPTIFALIVTGASAKVNQWGVCEDLHNLAKNVDILNSKSTSDGSTIYSVKYNAKKVDLAVKIRTWSWVRYLGFKGISSVYAYQANYPHYDSFLKSFDFIDLEVDSNNHLKKLTTLIGDSTQSEVLEEITFDKIERVVVEKPKSFKDLSRSYKG